MIHCTMDDSLCKEECREKFGCEEPCDECPAYSTEPDYEDEEGEDESN